MSAQYPRTDYDSVALLIQTIEEVTNTYKYAPLPKYKREGILALYNANLRGFDVGGKKVCVGGVEICKRYRRVVVGDYGPYVEFAEKDLLVNLVIPETQLWRTNAAFLEKRGLKIKYVWYEFRHEDFQAKIYRQVRTVKYADYQPGFYYIGVAELDYQP